MLGEKCDGRAALRAEIGAFRQGFGHPGLLTAALRAARLLLPVTADDRILTGTVRGVDWLCVFTDEGEYSAYRAAQGDPTPGRYRILPGRRVLDEIVPALHRPTGVVVDAAGTLPMAFPPEQVAP